MAELPLEMKGFGFNHKIIILKESPPSIMITRKHMVCENLGKRTSCAKGQSRPEHMDNLGNGPKPLLNKKAPRISKLYLSIMLYEMKIAST
jgi:hypothetical protein